MGDQVTRQETSGKSVELTAAASPVPSLDVSSAPTPGPGYLEVRVRSLTKIMPKAPDGHQPHELQAAALGVDVFHQGRRLCRGQAVFAFTKETEDREVLGSQRNTLP